MSERFLITGGCGFLGSNLAAEALRRGGRVTLFDNLSRVGASDNLAWLRGLGDVELRFGDPADADAVAACVAESAPDVVFHLAGQVAMTHSIADPRRDFRSNALGALNILEALRVIAPEVPLLFSSTNKVYGDLERLRYQEDETRYRALDHPRGFDERLALDFRSPYGCSKGAADQYVRDYARVYGLRTLVFRHSSIYGSRQFATYDQGWIGWFCKKALEIAEGRQVQPFTISGNGKQVRDVLHGEDLTRLYFTALARIDSVAGEVFNIGGGMENSLSLLELFAMLEGFLNIKMVYRQLPPRQSDQRVFVADIDKANQLLRWRPRVGAQSGIEKMLAWTAGRVG